jgi:hypothetical protein
MRKRGASLGAPFQLSRRDQGLQKAAESHGFIWAWYGKLIWGCLGVNIRKSKLALLSRVAQPSSAEMRRGKFGGSKV